MTRIRFQQSLDELKENLLVMAGLAEQAIQRAIEAYRVRDLSICDLVTRSENSINRLERDIDQAALDLLAMEQPMAIDLRFILSVIKINADLERVGDAAKAISDRVRNMEQMGVADLPVDIPRMATLATEMVRKSLQSFIEGDADLARSVLSMDDALDASCGLQSADQGDGGGEPHCPPGIERPHDLTRLGAGGRSRHQHCRRRDFLGAGR
jgi:phosphate transport system protein